MCKSGNLLRYLLSVKYWSALITLLSFLLFLLDTLQAAPIVSAFQRCSQAGAVSHMKLSHLHRVKCNHPVRGGMFLLDTGGRCQSPLGFEKSPQVLCDPVLHKLLPWSTPLVGSLRRHREPEHHTGWDKASLVLHGSAVPAAMGKLLLSSIFHYNRSPFYYPSQQLLSSQTPS